MKLLIAFYAAGFAVCAALTIAVVCCFAAAAALLQTESP